MSFRARLTLATALAVAVAIAIAAALVYVLVRDQQRNQVEDSLRARAAEVARGPLTVYKAPDGKLRLRTERGPGGFEPGSDIFIQATNADGEVRAPRVSGGRVPRQRRHDGRRARRARRVLLGRDRRRHQRAPADGAPRPRVRPAARTAAHRGRRPAPPCATDPSARRGRRHRRRSRCWARSSPARRSRPCDG